MEDPGFVRLRNLSTSAAEPVEDIVKRGVENLIGLSTEGTFVLRLMSSLEDGASRVYPVGITYDRAVLLTEPVDDPAVMATMTEDVFRRIAEGAYSPAQAVLDGAVEVRGNLELAREVVGRLADRSTDPVICPLVLLDEGYAAVGGSLTVAGFFFASNGPVELVYDFGGGGFDLETTADASGSFRVRQDGLPCGEILGNPGVGVIVTAHDRLSGRVTTSNFATPC